MLVVRHSRCSHRRHFASIIAECSRLERFFEDDLGGAARRDKAEDRFSRFGEIEAISSDGFQVVEIIPKETVFLSEAVSLQFEGVRLAKEFGCAIFEAAQLLDFWPKLGRHDAEGTEEDQHEKDLVDPPPVRVTRHGEE